MSVQLHVREKKKWKKYPCCIRDNQFIQFKDPKVSLEPVVVVAAAADADAEIVCKHFTLLQCHHELYKLGVNEFDIFVGIQQSRIDVKNPMPTRSVLPLPLHASHT